MSTGRIRHFVIDDNYRIGYRILGEGPETLFCFHGFGQDSSVFRGLQKAHPGKRIISFDLPFHGETEIPAKELTKKCWKKITLKILNYFKVKDVHVLAFSMGGRFAIRMAMDIPGRISSLTFIAADGFFYPPVYAFSTSVYGKGLFRYLLKKPEKLFDLSDRLVKYKLLNPSLVKMARYQLGPKSQRIRIYNSWVYLKPLQTDGADLAGMVAAHKIPVTVYTGKYDNVIRTSFFKKFLKLYKPARLVVLEKRHHEMISGYISAPSTTAQGPSL